MPQLSFLFVCLGNICRSHDQWLTCIAGSFPHLGIAMAEAVFAAEAEKRGLDVKVDSAGTGAYHAGDKPDERTIDVLDRHGVPWSCRARQVRPTDYAEFDYVFAMDKNNLSNLERQQRKGSKAQVFLFSHFTGKQINIQDPYYGGADGFDACYKQCQRYSKAILDHIEGKEAPAAD